MMFFMISLAVLFLLVIVLYNSLIGAKNQVDNAFGGIDAQLKKRYDLIPNLVETVKAYAKHEAETLEKVTSLRQKSGALSDDEKVELDNQISSAINGLMIAVEAYPELKASENFIQLQRSLNEIEEQIAASRRSYNAAVTDFNNKVEMFPSNILAKFMGFSCKQVFEIIDTERQNINVKSLFNE